MAFLTRFPKKCNKSIKNDTKVVDFDLWVAEL
jgi:hypothetical protein